MIKGATRIKYLRSEDVLKLTDGGYDVFMGYLGKVKHCMNRPWGEPETHPSWGLFPRAGCWFWKDQASEETGNCFHFVQKLFGIEDFNDAKKKIIEDFGLDGKGGEPKIIKNWDAPLRTEEYATIRFRPMPYTAKHHAFWNIVEVSEDYCKSKNCYAVKELVINGRRIRFMKDEMVFAFYAPEEEGVKIYFPERTEYRFLGNISYHYLWNYENVGECEDLIIQKSPKDMIVTSMVQPCVIATQNESIKVFDEDTIERINLISKRPWVWYGSDDDGVKKCKAITDCNKWRYVNTPKNLLPDVNDTYSFVKMHNTLNPGTGLRELETFMRNKKLLK